MENDDKAILTYFREFISDARNELFNRKAKERTRYLTVVLEDIFQPQNASAVLRSCDCFGIQDVHIIENRNRFTIDKEVVMGASKWLTLHKYYRKENNTADALRFLKKQGYRIVATTPHAGEDQLLSSFDLSKGKTALVFGTELQGISEYIQQEADEFLKIPMYGFTESLNISVSAAIIMFHLTNRLRTENQIYWNLSTEDEEKLILEWIKKSVKSSSLLEKNFLDSRSL